jgi:hypothetical protein
MSTETSNPSLGTARGSLKDISQDFLDILNTVELHLWQKDSIPEEIKSPFGVTYIDDEHIQKNNRRRVQSCSSQISMQEVFRIGIQMCSK